MSLPNLLQLPASWKPIIGRPRKNQQCNLVYARHVPTQAGPLEKLGRQDCYLYFRTGP